MDIHVKSAWSCSRIFKQPVSTMLQYRLYGGKALPSGLQGLLKASANIGSVIGQFGFGEPNIFGSIQTHWFVGYLADAFGRKAVYGKELMLIIIATILSISTPTGMPLYFHRDMTLNLFFEKVDCLLTIL
jgi:MFS family permease